MEAHLGRWVTRFTLWLHATCHIFTVFSHTGILGIGSRLLYLRTAHSRASSDYPELLWHLMHVHTSTSRAVHPRTVHCHCACQVKLALSAPSQAALDAAVSELRAVLPDLRDAQPA